MPYGNSGYPFVEEGNVLATRTILLILIAQWKGLRWVLEQPDGSFFPQLPRFQWLLKILKVRGHITKDFIYIYIYIYLIMHTKIYIYIYKYLIYLNHENLICVEIMNLCVGLSCKKPG